MKRTRKQRIAATECRFTTGNLQEMHRAQDRLIALAGVMYTKKFIEQMLRTSIIPYLLVHPALTPLNWTSTIGYRARISDVHERVAQ